MSTTRVVSACDVVEGRTPEASAARVGGRVLEIEGRRLRISDALAVLDVDLAAPVALAPGDLVVVDGIVAHGTLTAAHVRERQPHPAPRADGEHARLSWQGVGRRLAQRARALHAVRAYFLTEAFIEVETPVRVPTPGLDLHVDALGASPGYLITSPEHAMKRLLAGGLPRIVQLARCSRADERGALHEPEFLMLEWYRAFAGQQDVMRDTEQVVLAVAQTLSGAAELRIARGRVIDVTPPFDRITVRDAFRAHAGVSDAVDLARADEDRFYELLVGRVEPGLAALPRPVFLCDYPLTQASLARAAPDDASVAERFELYVAGVELCNGFGELTDPVEQRRRFERDLAVRRAADRPLYPVDERLLAALEEGLPPAGGNALGVDRLVALACGVESIAEVMAMPSCRVW